MWPALKMRLKLGFLLRAVLLVGSFLGLLLLWSSLSPRAEEPSPGEKIRVSGYRERDEGKCLRGERWCAAPRTGRRPTPAGCLGVGPKLSFDMGPAERGRWRLWLVVVLLPRLRPVALARPAKGQWWLWSALLRAGSSPLPWGGGGQGAAQQWQRAGGVS